MQTAGVASVAVVLLLYVFGFWNVQNSEVGLFIFGVTLSLGSLIAALGSNLMDVAIGQDWLPDLVTSEELSKMNSHLSQVDLVTEVGAPIAAGFILMVGHPLFPHLGFFLVALWNLLSFLPEISLLRSVAKSSEIFATKRVIPKEPQVGVFASLQLGWKSFRSHTAAGGMFAATLLWLSVLSPHGVLLTTFLKSDWNVSEHVLGIFRGGGALFGILGTLCFPIVRRKIGLLAATLGFLSFQFGSVALAFVFFWTRSYSGIAFLSCILFSRIGLYGFGIGETEIRQRFVSSSDRGLISGVVTSLTSFATLLLFALGAAFGNSSGFQVLVFVSLAAVGAACFLFWKWKQTMLEASEVTLQ